MSEVELTERCKKKETEACKRLYETFAGKMLHICFRYTGDIDTAHDLLHDGFLKVFTSISSFQYKGEGSLRAWLSKLFTNLTLEYLRKKDLLREGITLDDAGDLADETEPDADGLPYDVLMRFVTELPPGYRTVFNLYVFEEWSHKEIARELNIGEKSSASQLSRARKLLAARIREEIKKNK